jgi:hypothetical protein
MPIDKNNSELEFALAPLSLADLAVLQTTVSEMIEPLTNRIQSEPSDEQLRQIEKLQKLRELAATERVRRVADLLEMVS